MGVGVPEDLDGRACAPAVDGAAHEVFLAGLNHIHSHGVLEVEDQASADRFNDRGGARFFPVLRVSQVEVLGGVDVGNGAATDAVGNGVGHELTSDEQDTGCPWPADELVR